MKNPIYHLALSAAARMTGKPARFVRLALRSFQAIRHLGPREVTESLRMRVNDFGRLLLAYGEGRYRAIPAQSIVSVAAALLYFLNPLDLIPDALPALGLTDDFAILSWVIQHLNGELAAFRNWEEHTEKQ